MGFEGLLGNQRVKENLRQSLQKGRASHFYLICGPEGSGKRTLAKLLSAALMCEGVAQPCMRCEACRKVMASTHPDVITVTDPDHKNVPVKLVRQVREDMFIKPNEGKRKIYIFPQEMGIEGQNALLKVLEEPPSYGAFLLLADNPEKLLPTVRSRCVELSLTALPEELLRQELIKRFPAASAEEIEAAAAQSGGYLGQAEQILRGNVQLEQQAKQFAEVFSKKDALGLLQLLNSMEKGKRDQLIPVLEQWRQLLEQALAYRGGSQAVSPLARSVSQARSSRELLAALRQLEKCIVYAQQNVSVAAICGYLQWALR